MRTLFIFILYLTTQFLYAEKSTCTATPQMALGSHITEIVNEKINVSTDIIISGKVLSEKDCSPIKNVKISHWQTNSNSQYKNYLRAYMFTDINGKFKFSTEWPLLEKPHIHFIFEAPGFQKLTTQWVGDERIKKNILIIELTKKDKFN